MDKNAIKSFAIDSRRKLMEDVVYRMNLVGITSGGISEPISVAEGFETYDIGGTTHRIFGDDVKRRESLVREVQNKGFDNVIEEVAYTWFNRIIAIRFMEVNDYLPTRTRVLSSETPGKIEPDIITEALDIDLNYTEDDKKEIVKLLDDNKLDDLFRFLFIKQCNKLNEILPGLFEKTDDYMELLIGISFTNQDGVIRRLIEDIPEDDFTNQVEIIGWLYQFYNVELKDKTFDELKKKKIKIGKERIPAATQLFTPDWIVKYMVENSIGRYWLDSHPNEELKSKWKYYVEDFQQELDAEEQLISIKKESEKVSLGEIKIIDPCMGSGHILVYVFEVLMDIYLSEGYTKKDAAESILKNNIHGLDIDKRAYQLSYFAILMKARKYHRNVLNMGFSPILCSIEESNKISDYILNELNSNDLSYLVDAFYDAKVYGSILNIKKMDFDKVNQIIDNFNFNNNLDKFKLLKEIILLKNLTNQSVILSQNYDIVITNPPYMGNNGMNANLKNYLKKHYPNSKSDLFAVFIEKCHNLCTHNGLVAMITQQSFMFLSVYEKLRTEFLNNHTILNLVHLGAHAFEEIGGEVVQAASFISRNKFIENYYSKYIKLTEFNSEKQKEKEFFNGANEFIFKQKDFSKIPRLNMAYWVDENFVDSFNNINLGSLGHTLMGTKTANNDKYMRMFWEIDYNDFNFKWIPCAKGGEYKKYYGNLEMVIDWSDEAKDFYYTNKSSSLTPEKFCFKEGITYNSVSSKGSGFRFLPDIALCSNGGPTIINLEDIYYILGFLNSNTANFYLNVLNPTINLMIYNINSIPIIFDETYKNEIITLVKENVNIAKVNWDSYEVSFDFKKHPFLYESRNSLKDSFNRWCNKSYEDFQKLKRNEIRLNEIFDLIYNLNYIDANVNDTEITLNLPNYEVDIKSFISYAVGCMFGRYSLVDEGIQFAGGKFDLSNYWEFIPDDDNIIPVLDTEYFDDDIVGRFVEFVKLCFGEENLEENLDFIASALNKKGKTSKEIIRNYFLTDFFKDHAKIYKKCPIYWQFDSGKHNAFKCLIYLHRYDPTIVARVRTDYLHKTQKAIEQNIERCDNIIVSESPEKNKAEKLKSKLIKQLDEIKEYDIVLSHMANKKIEMDLNDGVKVNYTKFQNEDGKNILKSF